MKRADARVRQKLGVQETSGSLAYKARDIFFPGAHGFDAQIPHLVPGRTGGDPTGSHRSRREDFPQLIPQ